MTKEESAVKADKRERGGRKKEKVKPPTKVIMRHLPPTMTEEEFLKQIDPLPDHDFYYFSAADWSLGYDATCRAYITLKNYDDVYLFRDRFDGYVFVDSKGSEYPAIVEFAPFQGLLKNKRRSDNKMNSIEEESHYQQFLAKLEEDREAAAKGGECKLEFTLDRKKDEKITSTPLLQYLANKKEKRREEAKKRTEEKRRQRDEEKEKRRQTSQQTQQVTKIMSGADLLRSGRKDDKSASGGGGKEHDKGDKGKNQQEERKNSRSKRRAERDQRRREEHEQRKRERERTERQEGDKGKKIAEEDGGTKADSAANKAQTKVSESQQSQPKSDETKQRKDVKKYSEKRERERDRQRNRKDKEKEKEKEKEKQKESTSSLTVEEKPTTKQAVTENDDSVKSFIRSVASAREFVPKHKQAQVSEEEEQPQQDGATATTSKPAESKEVTTKLDTEYPNEDKTDEQKRSETLAARQLRRQRSAEERRIRNKDRPSIAIYTPKPRQRRVSEERDGKDRSNPPSDSENYKKDDQPQQRTKKVSRYSERRRLNREKPKSVDGEDELGGEGQDNDNDVCREQRPRKSKSCESGGSVKLLTEAELPTEIPAEGKQAEDNNENGN